MTHRHITATVLVVLHLIAAAGLVLLVLWSQVNEFGLAPEGRIQVGPVMEPVLLCFALVPTFPLALIESWSVIAPRRLWAGIPAALLAAGVHTWIGMLPVTLRFFGSRGPVTRFEVSMGLTSSALILIIHLVEVLILAVLLQRFRQPVGSAAAPSRATRPPTS